MTRHRPDWKPELLRQQREAHGLTLEESGEKMRELAATHDLNIAANFQTIWGHEKGTVYPGPHYRRAYCLLYHQNQAQLGFRRALPGEDTPVSAEPVAVPEPRQTQETDSSNAIVAALGSIQPGGEDVNSAPFRERVLDAWKRQAGGGTQFGSPTVIMVGGFAGSGKSEFAKFLGSLTGWPILDKDSITRPLVDQLLVALGGEPNDRHSDLYKEKVRPLEYRCLMEAAWDNLNCGTSTILDAPFIAEFSDRSWMQRFYNRCQAKRVTVSSIWVTCDADSMRENLEFRAAARDTWKLESWDEYLKTLNLELRPQGPHFVVDNRLGAAIALADKARDTLTGGSL